MNPFVGTPLALWMTSMMCWSNYLVTLQQPQKRYDRAS